MRDREFLSVKAGAPVRAPGPSPELSAYARAWRNALASAGRSCCCPAQPHYMVIMPTPSPTAEPVELFLCGHHYRVSRKTLAKAGAVVFDGDGPPMPVEP
jgi:hypothetical protein